MKALKKQIYILLISLIPSVSAMPLPQTEKISPYIQLQYFKSTEGQSAIQTTLTYSRNRMEIPISGMEISFFTGSENKKLIATVLTDGKGVARLPVDLGRLPADKENAWAFSTEFNGNDTVEKASSELQVRDLNLEVTCMMNDTVRTLGLEAWVSNNGKKAPAAGEVVMVYVPRMFSLLPVAEVTLNESGSGTVEFPADIPGDKEGNLKIISRIEENPVYGNVEKEINSEWGVPTVYSIPKTHRALWTKTPPTWMIITLSVLLTGVWGHYLFAIISLILIRIDAKPRKQKVKSDSEEKIAR